MFVRSRSRAGALEVRHPSLPADAALEAIEDYQSKFGDGMLAQEAKVMRIESLQRAGKHEQARAAAQQFLAQHPSSPLAPRARKVLSSTDK